MINAIVAVDENWGIGYNGALLERIPEDMKRFKELTTGDMVIMGRKTWESLPSKPLKDRFNVILSRNNMGKIDANTYMINFEELALILHNLSSYDDIWVIGGGQIYEALLPYCDKVYVTKIQKAYENVDTYFPNLDKSMEWQINDEGLPQTYNDLTYQFLTYDRTDCI